MMLSGIDVSAYQSSTPDVTGKAFVFVKATEGVSYVNPEQADQAATARAAGAVVGFYHFARPGDIQAQAQYFVDQCASVDGDILAVDWEDSGVSCADKDKLLKAVKALRPTHKVVLYCGRNFWLNVDTTSYCEDGLWIADYSHPAGSPAIQHPWLFHQFSQDGVDQDVANFATVDALKAWATGTPVSTPGVPLWRTLLDHVQAIPEKIYETWSTSEGWDNHTPFGVEYGEDGVSWCVIFDWDMFHDCGLDAIVPKTDNVNSFTSWAKARGQWSLYPSVGAWVNFEGGAHTEIVVGFDGTNVVTKGGNSIQAGATDNGQGNGVWTHTRARTDPKVTGYFAPRFPDGVCPPTADPKDPRGGAAVTSYTWPGPVVPETNPSTPKPATAPVVHLANLVAARKKDLPARTGHTTHPTEVRVIENALHAEGLLDKKWVDGSWGTETDKAYKAFRVRMGFTGKDASGDPGIKSLKMLAKRHKFTAK
ncbi:glycoside hydrolase family 25 protein [Streptomyces sp. NPDC051643]|uniref:glycoside hydrolase family 25 protein n=1 Tax=Streptomyces sp. NPDC051643 TaxID=3365665 RepID=UPI0037BAE228